MTATGVEPTVVPSAQDASGAVVHHSDRRPPSRMSGGRITRFTPYGMALPTFLILIGVFAWPLFQLIKSSFQHISQHNLFRAVPPSWVGFANYTEILTNSQFWTVALRTVIFTLATVAASMLIALLLASLMNRVSRWARLTLSVALMFVWSVPQIVSIQIFSWLTDPNFSVINWLLSRIPGINMDKHDWFLDPHQGLAVASTVVIWGAVPFLAITLHAGMTMVPKELTEAARMDGASAWRTFRAVTLPILRPLLVIVSTLSIIWDIQVFNQIWVLRGGQPGASYWTLSIFAYDTAINETNYELASAIGVITVLLMLGVMVFYMRQIFRIGDND
jgi:N,N'-diacetylchitobiose transport system permease protein